MTVLLPTHHPDMNHIAKHWKILLGFEDTKGVIRSCKSKDSKCNHYGQKKNGQKDKHEPHYNLGGAPG